MGLFSRNKPQPPPARPPRSAPSTLAVDWSDISKVRGEWPRAALDADADLGRFRRALSLYERDDYPAMMECATLLATALAHSLYGPGILRGDDLPDAIYKTIYTSLCPPPDGRTFADSAQKAVRVAMTVMRENGLQPPTFGGTMTFFEGIMTDKGNYLLLGSALAPPGQPWAGDLNSFFSVAPQPTIGALPDPEAERGNEMIDRLYDTLQQSKAGDAAATLYFDGVALEAQGNPAAALPKFSEAAKLGSVDAMVSAGNVSEDLGHSDDALFWYESAANAGHPLGMFNTAVAAIQKGNRPEAVTWFQRSAEAGHAEAYAALTQLAHEVNDKAGEAHWAEKGAEAGHLFCIGRHGLLLAMNADRDVPTMRRARDVLEQAADRGHLDSAALAVNLSNKLGDEARGQRYVQQVVQSGDEARIDQLRRYGYL